MFDVISIGSATLDVFLKVPRTPLLYGGKVEVEKLITCSGGGGTNTAVGFSRLGLKSAVLARCGWDMAGRLLRQELKKEAVDDSLLIQLENEETDYSTILIDEGGESTVLVARGQTRLEKDLIDFKKLQAKWFCISHLEGNLDLFSALLSYAQKNKIKVGFNPGQKEIKQKEKLLALVKNIDLLVVNQTEADNVGGNPAAFGAKMVAVTRGAAGVSLYEKSKILEADGFKMDMVDATGAGDAFFCGLVAGLIKNLPIEKALKLGIANGASVVTQVGAKAGLLSGKFIHNWLNKPLKVGWKKAS